MPKRIGYAWEELTSIENCEKAVLRAVKNKKKTKFIRHVKNNYEDYAYELQETIINGWKPLPVRKRTINEGTDLKQRELIIPSFKDHLLHTAVAMILEKYLAKRFYFYVCGSLPDKGQVFAMKAVEGRLRKKQPRYAAVADIKKCFKSIKKEQVMKCLRRVFKDERFLKLNEQILEQMGDGLAIGFTVSHWYAHLVMSRLDEAVKSHNMQVFLVRFMDNFVMLCGRKRKLHSAVERLKKSAKAYALSLKSDWQVFSVNARMIEFLSYRLNHDKTILKKKLMYKMARRFKAAEKRIDAHTAKTIMCYLSILKHCDSHKFKTNHMYPVVSIDLCRRLISDDDKKRILCYAA